ncbi:mRNA decay activator protein ZFP36L1-like [Centruroides sculpturatus]|uniref:mRNA decay activator protein ZFP36L1-like n=1 Tax=Centruroides sculpturatus TaxID=218467 RepID=UPI000C6D3399|nr:mRNA decay activator protein ZFP36L1-like [Centruroides sculpturatus]
MSTALVSPMYDFGDVMYKTNNLTTHKETYFLDRKATMSFLSSHRRITASPPSPKSQHQKGSSSKDRKLDRSLSESAASQQQQPRPNQANSSRYKTELCRPYEENGTCKYGDKCQFAHGAQELRTLARHPKYKTELCRTFHSTGFCPYGPRCHFIHNSEETKQNLLNNLQIGNLPTMPTRPKALSLGSFSLGSVGDPSPPSSLSGSPTSLNSFFGDDPYNNSNTTPNMAANTAFSFSQDFASLVKPPYPTDVESSVYDMETASPPSPVESLGSDIETLSLNSGSPVPTNSPIIVDGNKIPRLPIFSRLANFP